MVSLDIDGWHAIEGTISKVDTNISLEEQVLVRESMEAWAHLARPANLQVDITWLSPKG